jgi:hypothetical protein
MSMIAPAWKKPGKIRKIECYYTKNPRVVKKISGISRLRMQHCWAAGIVINGNNKRCFWERYPAINDLNTRPPF